MLLSSLILFLEDAGFPVLGQFPLGAECHCTQVLRRGTVVVIIPLLLLTDSVGRQA